MWVPKIVMLFGGGRCGRHTNIYLGACGYYGTRPGNNAPNEITADSGAAHCGLCHVEASMRLSICDMFLLKLVLGPIALPGVPCTESCRQSTSGRWLRRPVTNPRCTWQTPKTLPGQRTKSHVLQGRALSTFEASGSGCAVSDSGFRI